MTHSALQGPRWTSPRPKVFTCPSGAEWRSVVGEGLQVRDWDDDLWEQVALERAFHGSPVFQADYEWLEWLEKTLPGSYPAALEAWAHPMTRDEAAEDDALLLLLLAEDDD